MSGLARLALVMGMALGAASCKCRQEAPVGRDAAAPTAPIGDSSGGGARIDPEQARFDEERRPDLIIAAAGIGPGDRVADIGSGSGLLTVHLARAVMPGGKVVATEINQAVMAILVDRLVATKLTDVVEARLVEPETPSLEPGAYDVILLAEVDNFLTDPVAWLQAAKPALKPDGAIAITNRIYHRTRALGAARAAGLHLVSESTPVPSTFIAVYRLGAPATPPSSGKPSTP